MKNLSFASQLDTIAVETQSRLLDALLSRKVKVKMLCDGPACARQVMFTCAKTQKG